MRTNRLLPAVFLAALAMAGTTACGSDGHPKPVAANGLDGLSGDEIVARALAAGERAPSVRTVARQGGAQGRTTTIKAFAARSGDCIGEVSQGDPIVSGAKLPPLRVELLRKGSQTWMREPVAPGEDRADDKWIAGRGSVGTQLFDTCELAFVELSYLDETTGDPNTPWIREGVTRIGGVPAVLLHQWTGEVADELSPTADESEAVQVAIAAEGEPYLLRLKYGAGDGGTILFSDYGAPMTVTPPSADQVIDVDLGSFLR
ncbi:hypothetical protein ACIQF6_04965 [Kitasatospora sp. NPDC092948]|uniref:hypothetical protein n=1 Tax=Kitasatospora sp. NPDC092948 TaxID=3364088 RepID=UPI0037FC0DE2